MPDRPAINNVDILEESAEVILLRRGEGTCNTERLLRIPPRWLDEERFIERSGREIERPPPWRRTRERVGRRGKGAWWWRRRRRRGGGGTKED